jgi:glutamine---fructose-6-phosphate transaminase (isomerizing)
MQDYLATWERRAQEIDVRLGEFEELFLIGRGASLSAVWNGSLINKEAARAAFEGMHAADFRHGPLEIVSEGFAALIFAGASQTSALNRGLAREIIAYGGKAIWLDSVPDPELPTLLFPETSEWTRPLAEILPIQMLTLAMANRKRLQAGHFRHVSKITDHE